MSPVHSNNFKNNNVFFPAILLTACRSHEGGFKRSDLFISFKNTDGKPGLSFFNDISRQYDKK
jgi:hypothetical protein